MPLPSRRLCFPQHTSSIAVVSFGSTPALLIMPGVHPLLLHTACAVQDIFPLCVPCAHLPIRLRFVGFASLPSWLLYTVRTSHLRLVRIALPSPYFPFSSVQPFLTCFAYHFLFRNLVFVYSLPFVCILHTHLGDSFSIPRLFLSSFLRLWFFWHLAL